MEPKNPRQLLVTKQLFTEGKVLALHGDDFSALKAVLLLDLSVELMLNILITDFGSGRDSARDDMKWSQLWQQATCAVKDANIIIERIPFYKDLRDLHNMRNLAQHSGRAPNP